jgi:hypothetical protein
MPRRARRHGQPLVELLVAVREGDGLSGEAFGHRLSSDELAEVGAEHEFGELAEAFAGDVLVYLRGEVVEVDCSRNAKLVDKTMGKDQVTVRLTLGGIFRLGGT